MFEEVHIQTYIDCIDFTNMSYFTALSRRMLGKVTSQIRVQSNLCKTSKK